MSHSDRLSSLSSLPSPELIFCWWLRNEEGEVPTLEEPTTPSPGEEGAQSETEPTEPGAACLTSVSLRNTDDTSNAQTGVFMINSKIRTSLSQYL